MPVPRIPIPQQLANPNRAEARRPIKTLRDRARSLRGYLEDTRRGHDDGPTCRSQDPFHREEMCLSRRFFGRPACGGGAPLCRHEGPYRRDENGRSAGAEYAERLWRHADGVSGGTGEAIRRTGVTDRRGRASSARRYRRAGWPAPCGAPGPAAAGQHGAASARRSRGSACGAPRGRNP